MLLQYRHIQCCHINLVHLCRCLQRHRWTKFIRHQTPSYSWGPLWIISFLFLCVLIFHQNSHFSGNCFSLLSNAAFRPFFRVCSDLPSDVHTFLGTVFLFFLTLHLVFFSFVFWVSVNVHTFLGTVFLFFLTLHLGLFFVCVLIFHQTFTLFWELFFSSF